MSVCNHKLEVLFDTDKNNIIYDGIIYHSKQTTDNVTISQNSIAIGFDRSSKKKKEEILDSPRSIIRYHLQKALCFYLVTQGELPPVKDIVYTCGKETVSIQHEHFTCHWNNCKVSITLPVENAKVIFESEKGKPFYVIITHFLKAQLDHFSHDRFRSAWSTLNAFYTYIDALSNSGYRREEDKLSTLGMIIDNNEMYNSLSFVKSLDSTRFWSDLSWYSVFNGLSEKNMRKFFNGSSYNDTELIKCFYKYMNGIQHIEEEFPDVKEEFTAKITRRTINRPSDKLKFIVCKYCYNKRNNSYHAVEAYPLFVISECSETNIEQKLTEIILLTVKDLFIIYSGNL